MIKEHAVFSLLFFSTLLSTQDSEIPFEVNPLFQQEQPETLGLSFAKEAESYTIFSPTENSNKYNHGVVLFPFKGMLYAQWQSSSQDEDGADTQVFYSKSSNGKDWESPKGLNTDLGQRNYHEWRMF